MSRTKICPWCSSKNVSYGFGINPSKPKEAPRDLVHCNECDRFWDYYDSSEEPKK